MAESFANSLVVEVEGAPLPADVKSWLTTAYVDTSRNLPDVFVLRFRDPGHVVLGKGKFTVGAKVVLKVQTSEPGAPEQLMAGEVTALGVELDAGGTFTEVRGYAVTHRLFRGRRVAAYPGMTVGDVVRKVVRRASLAPGRIDGVSGFGGKAETQISQEGVSDWEFLSRLAADVGAQIGVTDGKVDFRLPERPSSAPGSGAKSTTNPFALEMHRSLLSLRASVTSAEQVPEVVVGGWNPEAKEKVTATATPTTPGTQADQADPAKLAGKFGAAPFLASVANRTQPEVKAVAEALAAQLGGACVELSGVARGNPKLRAGSAVALVNVGEQFAGKYTLTSARHLFSGNGYTTEFTVSGRQERSLYGLANGPATAARGDLVPGIVSDVKDPAKLGRVKLTFPWLAPDFTSGWARVLQQGAGKGRGSLVVPEVGDEVLVGFEHGSFDSPYVLGGLHNPKDVPPELSVDPVDGGAGAIAARGFVSRAGHRVEFVETDGILISSGDGKFAVRIDQKKQTVEITSDKTVVVKAANGVSIDAGKGPLELKGQKITATSATDVAVEAKAAVKLSGTSGVKVEGASVSVAARGQAELTASGVVTVRGGLVKIN
ncbi:VgrG-related protein [Actinosynnema mirum]|uniref:Rhs element Vgr protein n=1 Tax=Actinosynnema mirum (strain ATCC 29888 / DSM 43827 / JCM 3225 / NBRC 14064 / NCIMB 13271 / NRRL B-12336 / IMRU 3971 / 101) TaxID=446462 RepID=C6WA14_ACTMD|nr:VgrG-related protein [Actinosynnema mirum]ACU39203.1 Rhs element Vgr protein [Actinosynnema mirum DSM 43827]